MQGKVLPERSAQTPLYVGIDVCKDWLDVHLHPVGQSVRVANKAVGIKSLKGRLNGLPIDLIVMEATAKFHREAHRGLHASGYAVAVVNPLRSRLFAEAIGQLAKTDRIDARVLAIMAEALKPKAAMPRPQALEEMQEPAHARSAAIADQTALSNQRGASHSDFLKTELAQRLEGLRDHIARLDAEIKRALAADPALQHRYDLVISIPGVGPVAALALVVGLPELGTASGKALTLLAGLAPVACESGESAGERHIRGGRAQVRTGLYMAAVAAARYNSHLSAFYKSLCQAGKKPKVALTAVMRKLVVLANTLIRENRKWQEARP